jgi:hypothetical protein
VRVAADPFTGKRITPGQYREKYAGFLDVTTIASSCLPALCPLCAAALGLNHDAGRDSNLTFVHPDDVFCPMRSLRHQYVVSPRQDEIPEVSAALRTSFFSRWRKHWFQFRKHAKHADISTFIGLLKYADSNGIWKYPGIKEHEIVAVLLALKDFEREVIIEKGLLRQCWTRFWFESPVVSLDDFWTLPDVKRRIVKAIYFTPEDIIPIGSMDLHSFKIIDIEQEYLSAGGDLLAHRHVERRMLRAFSKELAGTVLCW